MDGTVKVYPGILLTVNPISYAYGGAGMIFIDARPFKFVISQRCDEVGSL